MKNTPYYALSYPENPDHTRTWEYWQSLATQIENLIKGGFRIPTGNLHIGEATSTNYYWVSWQNTQAGDTYQTLQYLGPSGYFTTELMKNSVTVNRLRLGPTGDIRIEGSGQSARMLPYAMSTGRTLLTVTNTVRAQATITFSAGRYTAAPVVVATAEDELYNTAAAFITTSSYTLIMHQILEGLATGGVNVNWCATQMTPSSGPWVARAADPRISYEIVDLNAVCHTEGCDNADESVIATVPVFEGEDPLAAVVMCGVCGQQITDLEVA